MRRYLNALYGNDRSRAMLGTCIEQEILPHALILEGPSGSGKRTLAKELTAALVCENKKNATHPLPCHACRACRLVEGENATDVHFIRKGDKASLGVELIRDMRSDIYLSSTEFDARIYIFEDAHTMTVQAQNALLIILEEPPPNVHFLLLAERAEDLLDTIKSRARTVRLERLDEASLIALLNERHPSTAASYESNQSALRAAARSADGRAGEFLRLLEAKQRDALQKQRKLTLDVLRSFAGGRYSLLCESFSALPTKRDELTEALSLLSLAVRDLILLKKDENTHLTFFLDKDECEALLASFRADKLFHISDAINQAVERLDRNANAGTVLSMLKATLRSK